MGNKVSLIKVLLPLPETPVIAIKQPRGISISIDFRLLPCAPFKDRAFPCPVLLFLGIPIFFFPDKYCPVRDSFDLYNFSGEKLSADKLFPLRCKSFP